MRVRVHCPGPDAHGVARHAAALRRLLAGQGAELVEHGADVVHTQFTDALWGPDIASAAAAFAEWAGRLDRPLVVTLHDLPGADPDAARDRRRSAGYARVVEAADVVVVSSEHEAAKVTALCGLRPTVVELPVEPLPVDVLAAGPRPAWADRPSVGVLGFVYPGKGHADVVDAAARQPDPPLVVAAGAVSPGHDDLWAELTRRAGRAGVELLLTGTLDDAGMGAAARAVTVPVVPGAAVSASGTLGTWWGCGRRPLAAAGAYAREKARCRPGAVILYSPGDLDAALATALAHPERTRTAVLDTGAIVAAAHLRTYARAGAIPC